MKILVAYYSRTGSTEKVCREIAKKLKTDTDPIIDERKREGLSGWILGGRDVIFDYNTKIKYEKDPKFYDIVIVGTPIWVGREVPAIKEYLKKNSFKRIAFVCTCAGNNKEVFAHMIRLSKKPIATLEIKQAFFKNEEYQNKIDEFCKKIKKLKIDQ